MKNTGQRYDVGGLVVLTILMVVSIVIIYFSWNNMEYNYNNMYQYIYEHGFEFIICIFFIGTGVYCWFMYIVNSLVKPKEKVLILDRIDNDEYMDVTGTVLVFLDSRGKQYFYTKVDDKNYEIEQFYKVLKTNNNIKQIIEVSSESFEIKPAKESFFLTWYSPKGKHENIFLLPIIYIVFLPGLLSLIMATGFDKIYGIIFSAFPGYLIIYDLYYKIFKKDE